MKSENKPGCSSHSMDVCVCIFWTIKLNDPIHCWKICVKKNIYQVSSLHSKPSYARALIPVRIITWTHLQTLGATSEIKTKLVACISIHKQSFSSSKKVKLIVCSFPKLWQCNEWNINSHLTRIDMLYVTQIIKHPVVNNYITRSDPLLTLTVNMLHHWALKLAVVRLHHFSCHIQKYKSPS